MPDVPRYKKILNILDNYDSCTINDLARLLTVSHMSIRRDLKQLQERGLVHLAYGGLVKKRFLDQSPGYDVKSLAALKASALLASVHVNCCSRTWWCLWTAERQYGR